jgi:uncharacterized protein (UPF0264 family)
MFSFDRPGLLVSVRNTEEALVALEGGADVIDVKEPNRGSLGAADLTTISEIVRTVNQAAPVTAALGEMIDLPKSEFHRERKPNWNGISVFKIGLSQCRELRDWQKIWSTAIFRLRTAWPDSRPVAVQYADWQAARAPAPHDLLQAAIEHRCPALLIDTWDKSAGSLFDHWPPQDLREFLARVRSHRISVVLAGSLGADDFQAAAALRPDLLAVRGAACIGGRGGTVSAKLVRQLKLRLADLSKATTSKR